MHHKPGWGSPFRWAGILAGALASASAMAYGESTEIPQFTLLASRAPTFELSVADLKKQLAQINDDAKSMGVSLDQMKLKMDALNALSQGMALKIDTTGATALNYAPVSCQSFLDEFLLKRAWGTLSQLSRSARTVITHDGVGTLPDDTIIQPSGDQVVTHADRVTGDPNVAYAWGLTLTPHDKDGVPVTFDFKVHGNVCGLESVRRGPDKLNAAGCAARLVAPPVLTSYESSAVILSKDGEYATDRKATLIADQVKADQLAREFRRQNDLFQACRDGFNHFSAFAPSEAPSTWGTGGTSGTATAGAANH